MFPAKIIGCLPLFKLRVAEEVVELMFKCITQYSLEEQDDDCLQWVDGIGAGIGSFCVLFPTMEVGKAERVGVCALFATTEAGTAERVGVCTLFATMEAGIEAGGVVCVLFATTGAALPLSLLFATGKVKAVNTVSLGNVFLALL
jgi:hypothetical protein